MVSFRSALFPIVSGARDSRCSSDMKKRNLLKRRILADIYRSGADGDITMCFCRRLSTPTNTTATPSIASDLSENTTTPSHPHNTPAAWPWTPGPSERFAPCWRHEEFPYLTVSEVFDVDAGVRISARHCFMLETLSVHVQPGMISVKGATRAADDDDPPRSRRKSLGNAASGKKKNDLQAAAASRSGEVQFFDSMWGELMAKGHIAGDERWIVGEDEKGFVTVVRF